MFGSSFTSQEEVQSWNHELRSMLEIHYIVSSVLEKVVKHMWQM